MPHWSCRAHPSVTTPRPRRCTPSPSTATSSPSTTSTCPAHVLDLLVAEGVELHPRPAALRFAQDKLAMRERLTELGIPCPRWARAATVADVDGLRGCRGLAGRREDAARRLRRQGGARRGGCRGARRLAGARGIRGLRPAARGAGAVPPRARRARRPLAVGPGRRVAGRRDGAARRHLHRGARAGPRAGCRVGGRRRARRPAPGRRARRDRGAGRRAVRGRRRRRRAGLRRQRARDAPAQLRPLDDRRRGDRPVRAAPAGRARLPAGRHRGRTTGGR